MSKKQTREEKLTQYLNKYRNITSLEAIKMFGETRLSARIYDLKKKGYNFSTKRIRVRTRDGWTYVAQYTLMGRWLGLRG